VCDGGCDDAEEAENPLSRAIELNASGIFNPGVRGELLMVSLKLSGLSDRCISSLSNPLNADALSLRLLPGLDDEGDGLVGSPIFLTFASIPTLGLI
jgi:hypothetical protein